MESNWCEMADTWEDGAIEELFPGPALGEAIPNGVKDVVDESIDD